MKWNWQQKDWPNFTYRTEKISDFEARFLQRSGMFFGAYKHITEDERKILIVDLISEEALKTSEIEGEMLSRDSIQSSLRRQFGLEDTLSNIPSAEQGIADMMVNLYETYSDTLTHQTLHDWHKMLTRSRRDLECIGQYRTHADPMQVVSGYLHKPTVHFEAPPSARMQDEMTRFIAWFNDASPSGKRPMPALARAAVTHLYFVCIHPYEDGNGRIARALTEKALAQSIGQPSLVALSKTIEASKKDYYQALEDNNKRIEITDWLIYFAETILAAQDNAEALLEFIIAKSKLFDRLRGLLNQRQEKALLRMFQEGPSGFKGGMSAEKYISTTGASRATATRDLQDLMKKGALKKTGRLKGTRYWLNI